MKAKELNGVVKDFLEFMRDYPNPMEHVWVEKKMEMNLITGEIDYPEEDSVTTFFREKRKWFLNRIKQLNGDVNDFDEAKLIVFGAKEKIILKYKGKTFENELVHFINNLEIKKEKERIKNLPVFDINKKKWVKKK